VEAEAEAELEVEGAAQAGLLKMDRLTPPVAMMLKSPSDRPGFLG
jgi:hypothetical protein